MSVSAPLALSAGGATCGAAIAGMAWAVRGRSASVFGPSVWRGKPGRNAIALTFDDGPTPGTMQILEILRRHGAKATFFQVGARVASRPDLARAVRDEGHELGNHSHTHPLLAGMRPTALFEEFEKAQHTIFDATGRLPAWVRAPYGVRWPGFGRMQRRLNMTGAMWTTIGRDWKLPADAIAARVIDRARDGHIVCLHDGRGTLEDPDISATVEAVRQVVPILLGKGYHFETVTQLICPMK